MNPTQTHEELSEDIKREIVTKRQARIVCLNAARQHEQQAAAYRMRAKSIENQIYALQGLPAKMLENALHLEDDVEGDV